MTNTTTFSTILPENEALLKAWLRLSTSVINSRIVSAMSYNEALVCNILYPLTKAGRTVTATALCQATKMLKSQMNRTLNLLENKGMIVRERSTTDKRQVLIRFNMDHAKQYEELHKEVLSIIDHISSKLNKEESQQAIHLLTKLADLADDILE